jgi:diguanylate cyclase (GGDEF)-like protein
LRTAEPPQYAAVSERTRPLNTAFLRERGGADMKILIIDDDPSIRFLLGACLRKWGYEFAETGTCEEALEIIEREKIRFLICDWVMPTAMQGIDLVNRLRSSIRHDYLYVIMLTAKNGRIDILQGLAAGLDDYICKPFDAKELRIRVQMGQRILSLKQEILELNRRVGELAGKSSVDAVTGVYNRASLFDHIDTGLARCRDQNLPFSLILIFLSRHRRIKDTYGYRAADSVITEVADRLRKVLRTRDFMGRFSDEELVIALHGMNEEECAALAALVADVLGKPYLIEKGVTVQVSAEVAPATSLQGDRDNAESLIFEAMHRRWV